MKPLFHKVPTSLQSSFEVRHTIEPNFEKTWHYHPELELHYVVKGEGVRFIGDNISNFSSGELILLGENLPHTWRCNEEYYMDIEGLDVEALVIQFLPDCLGKDFINLPESYLIPKLFEKAKKGMIIHGDAKEKIIIEMRKAPKANQIDKLIILINILKFLSEAEGYDEIASAHAFYQSNESDSKRLNKIYNYTLSNYKRDISLKEIADLSNLSVTSFCRYFKLMTKKTYYDFLVEIRISHASRMLIENKAPTELICFQCGFNNVSNFYRHFKKVSKMTRHIPNLG